MTFTNVNWTPQDLANALFGQAGTATAWVPSVVLEPRTSRMLLTAIRSSRFVVLVGPPGTGKGAAIADLIARIQHDPGSLGFGNHGPDWPDPIKRTPDDSWTAFDLLGGLAPAQSGYLEYTEGALLRALKENRWLILDELNRGELDKIFGPMLTWLANEDVDLERTDTSPAGRPQVLRWDDSQPASGRRDPGGATPISYVAGSDWRMLGTYNPQDAQRVFGIGQALGRRFRQIPIPPMDPDEFPALLAERVSDCPADLRARISGLYEAHYSSVQFSLGPALFIEMARYVAAAVAEGIREEEAVEVLAEGYVLSIGRYLSGYRDSDRDALGATNAFNEAFGPEWTWVQQQISTLR